MYDLAVIGLGYVGLPLAIEATRSGFRVVGIDIDEHKVATLKAGHSYVDDVSDGEVAHAIAGGFSPSADPADIAGAAAVSICVPTPLRDHAPDLTAVVAAAETVGAHLTAGTLVVLESTTYPGTTEEVVLPLLEKHSGLVAGRDFLVAYSPERIDPGNRDWTLRNTPKIVAGIDQDSTDAAVRLYSRICESVVTVSSPKTAETAKLLENTYRHINIALVNEMAIFCHELGIDIWEAIEAADTKPFGYQAFWPGPGVGGHCVPIDPSYLSYRVRQLGYPFRFVELAHEINDQMPGYVVERTAAILEADGKTLRDARVLLLGVAYKPNVSDTREAPSRNVVRMLREQGTTIRYADPHVPALEVDGVPVERVEEPMAALATTDLVVVLTAHRAFDLAAVCRAFSPVFDATGKARFDGVHTL